MPITFGSSMRLPSSSKMAISEMGQGLPTVPGFASHSSAVTSGAAAFAGGVVLVDGVAPPVDHVVLDVDRAGGGGVDHVAQRRQVVLGPHVLGQGQQAVELGRHHVGGGHPVALDEPQHLFGRPLVHEHHGVAHVERRAPEAQHGGVVERRADDVDVVVMGLDAEEEQDAGQAEGGLVGSRRRSSLRKMPLGLPVVPEV